MRREASPVTAAVRYIDARWKGAHEKPRIGSRESRRAVTSFQRVDVRDARPRLAAGELDLDRTGFTLTEHESAFTAFSDPEQVAERYYPEMQVLIRRMTGAAQVLVYGHLVRTETPVDFNDGYARFVHCDYNARRIAEMSRGLLERRGVRPQPGRTYAWYNTWQPFDHEVQRNPLAMIDSASLAADDVIDYLYTGRGRDNLAAAPVYNPDHRLFCFPRMATSEVIVMKQMDARPDRAVYCPHTSFDDPTSVADAPPRRSIEVRLMAVFPGA